MMSNLVDNCMKLGFGMMRLPRIEGTNNIDLEHTKRMVSEGVIRHYGFSFHSTPEHLEQLLTDHPDVEFVQLQINYADWEDTLICSRRCYEIATQHGKPVRSTYLSSVY